MCVCSADGGSLAEVLIPDPPPHLWTSTVLGSTCAVCRGSSSGACVGAPPADRFGSTLGRTAGPPTPCTKNDSGQDQAVCKGGQFVPQHQRHGITFRKGLLLV